MTFCGVWGRSRYWRRQSEAGWRRQPWQIFQVSIKRKQTMYVMWNHRSPSRRGKQFIPFNIKCFCDDLLNSPRYLKVTLLTLACSFVIWCNVLTASWIMSLCVLTVRPDMNLLLYSFFCIYILYIVALMIYLTCFEQRCHRRGHVWKFDSCFVSLADSVLTLWVSARPDVTQRYHE